MYFIKDLFLKRLPISQFLFRTFIHINIHIYIYIYTCKGLPFKPGSLYMQILPRAGIDLASLGLRERCAISHKSATGICRNITPPNPFTAVTRISTNSTVNAALPSEVQVFPSVQLASRDQTYTVQWLQMALGCVFISPRGHQM